MGKYYVDEAVFELPFETWRDKSVTLLEARLESGNDVSVGVQRGPYPKGVTAAQFVDRHVENAARSLRSYALLSKSEREVAGLRALEVKCRWRNGKHLVSTLQTFVDLGEKWLLVSINGRIGDAEAIERCSERVLTTLKFREPG